MEGITIQQVKANSPAYLEVYDLRESILRKPLGLSLANEDLSHDKDDIIVAAADNGKIVACIMLQHRDAAVVKFRQMAVADHLQGKGIGNMLMEAAEEISREKNYRKVVLHARESAAGFYTKLGYTITSGLFTEVGIPHYVMEKEI